MSVDEASITSESDSKDPLIGVILGDAYQVESPLAVGSMGSVYRGRHLRLSQAVAIKFLALHLMEDEEARERFQREATIMCSLQHPNIARLLDFGVTDSSQPYLVLELLKGESLEAKLQRRAVFDVRQTVEVFSQLASALRAAHRLGVVHRDMKPANIMIEEVPGGFFGKLLDFGISKEQGKSTGLTGQFDVMGTPSYMPPEQASGQTANVDERADQFGLAACLYEVLTGRPPFEGETVMETLRQVIALTPPRPSSLCAELPLALDETILRALSKDPDDRYPNMDHFGRALRGSLGLSGFTPSIVPGPLESIIPRPPTSQRVGEKETIPAAALSNPGSIDLLLAAPVLRAPLPHSAPLAPLLRRPSMTPPSSEPSTLDIPAELSRARSACLGGSYALSLTHLRAVIRGARRTEGKAMKKTLADVVVLLSELMAHWGARRSSRITLVGRKESLRSQEFLEPEDVYLMSLFEQCANLEEVIDVSPLPEAETLHRVATLFTAGVVSASGDPTSFEESTQKGA